MFSRNINLNLKIFLEDRWKLDQMKYKDLEKLKMILDPKNDLKVQKNLEKIKSLKFSKVIWKQGRVYVEGIRFLCPHCGKNIKIQSKLL